MNVTISKDGNGRVSLYCKHPKFVWELVGGDTVSVSEKDLFSTMYEISDIANNKWGEECTFDVE